MNEPTIKRGSKQADWVNYAKRLLDQYWITPGSMALPMDQDGVFDETMEDLVKSFQEREGLSRDGKIGRDTWAALTGKANAAAQTDDQPTAEEQAADRMAQISHDPSMTDDNRYRVVDGVKVLDMSEEEIVVTLGKDGKPVDVDWNGVVTDMITRARQNVQEQVPWFHQAVSEFAASSTVSIGQWAAQMRQFEEDARVELPWSMIVDGLDSALGLAFSGPGGMAGWVYGKLKSAVLSDLADELATKSMVPGLEQGLLAGVAALKAKVDGSFKQVIDDFKAEGAQHIEERMREYLNTPLSNDSGWIDEMVAWFGFPEKSVDEIKMPIKEWLDHQLGEMLRAASDQVLNA